jgi:prophage regulatory protein
MTRLIRLNEVMRLTGLSRSSIYAQIANNLFPRQVKLGQRCVAWTEGDIQVWIEEKIETSQRSADQNSGKIPSATLSPKS